MKTKSILNLLFICFISINGNCQNVRKFNFIYIQGRNQLDSKKNIFIKDMVTADPIQFKMKLNKKEKKSILKKLNEINFGSYPEHYRFEAAREDGLIGKTQPCFGRSMTVSINSKLKTVTWSDCEAGDSKNRMHEKLIELDFLLMDILTHKKEYINSPPALGGYD